MMKTHYLLPHRFKAIGWILLVPGVAMAVAGLFFNYEPSWMVMPVFAIVDDFPLMPATHWGWATDNVFNEVFGLLLILGLLFVAMSKEKLEDEFISRIRMESLVWATYVNFAILILANLFIFGVAFFWVLVFNMVTILVFFIIRFNWVLYRSKRAARHEK